jgi:hypothetical protein
MATTKSKIGLTSVFCLRRDRAHALPRSLRCPMAAQSERENPRQHLEPPGTRDFGTDWGAGSVVQSQALRGLRPESAAPNPHCKGSQERRCGSRVPPSRSSRARSASLRQPLSETGTVRRLSQRRRGERRVRPFGPRGAGEQTADIRAGRSLNAPNIPIPGDAGRFGRLQQMDHLEGRHRHRLAE